MDDLIVVERDRGMEETEGIRVGQRPVPRSSTYCGHSPARSFSQAFGKSVSIFESRRPRKDNRLKVVV